MSDIVFEIFISGFFMFDTMSGYLTEVCRTSIFFATGNYVNHLFFFFNLRWGEGVMKGMYG